MKKLLLLVAALALCPALFAAQPARTVTGLVADSLSREPVGFATVVLLRDTTVIDAVAADAEGRFKVKAASDGRYTLQVTMVGYGRLEQSVEVASALTDLGTLLMRQGVEIGDVVVAVQKPLVVSDAEKMTYSVEDDPQASSSTLEEIIRKVPQLSLDADGNVLLNGQSSYKILLNGHQATTLSNNFKEVIKSMPASQIKKIEVITNPSTKYEAEGAGGIINLITEKKREFDGYNGSLSAGATTLSRSMYYGNANASVQLGKFAAGVMAYYNHYSAAGSPTYEDSWQENLDSDSRYQSSHSESDYNGQNYGFSLDLSYQPDTLNLLTFNGWMWGGKNRNNIFSQTSVLDPQNDPLIRFGTDAHHRWNYIGGSVALNYEHTFRKEGHTLTLSDETEIDPDDGRSLYDFTGDYDHANLRTEDNRTVSNTAQIDYVNPLSEHHNIEAGLKHIYRYNKSFARIMQADDAGLFPEDDADRDDMHYKQNILGIYAGYGITFKKWSGRVGARMERTWNHADVDDSNDEAPYSFDNRQFNVIPYVSLTYLPKDGHSLSFSYTERLQRPGIWMLSPAVDDTEPLVTSYGNPHLKAAVFHSFNLQYSYFCPKWSMNFALKSFLSNNYMASYSFVDTQGVTHSTYSNDVHTRSYGFNGSFSYRPSTKLNISLSYQGDYSKYDYAAMGIYSDHFAFNENLNIDFAVWKEARVMLGEYFGTGKAMLGGRGGNWYYYYVGIKQQFFKKKLDISVTLSNPFNKYTQNKNYFDTPTYNGWNAYKQSDRRLNFSVSWRFGKQNIGVKRAARTIENDDISGGSKGGGGGGQ